MISAGSRPDADLTGKTVPQSGASPARQRVDRSTDTGPNPMPSLPGNHNAVPVGNPGSGRVIRRSATLYCTRLAGMVVGSPVRPSITDPEASTPDPELTMTRAYPAIMLDCPPLRNGLTHW